MKKPLFFCFFAISFLRINAQDVEATTASGKKIMINIDNYTWRYANSEDGQKSCFTFHTGDVNFINKTTKDVYLYYSKAKERGKIKYIKIQPGESEPVKSLQTNIKSLNNSNEMVQFKYGWVASYELYSNLNQYHVTDELGKLKGFNSGEFTLDDCEIKEINIKD